MESSEIALDRSKLRSKKPVLKFALLFLFLTGLANLLFYVWFTKTTIFESYLNLCTSVSSVVIGWFGESVRVIGSTLESNRCSIQVRQGCDAIQPALILIGGVIAFPSRWSSKIWGAVIGTLILQILNIVRIVTLYFIRAERPDLFDVMHVDVWQVGFIFIALLLWMLWLRWAVPVRRIEMNRLS